MPLRLSLRRGFYGDAMTDPASHRVDLDLRLISYFVAVAEHRHFGRAAAALRVAQPSLSRQIRSLEQQIGRSHKSRFQTVSRTYATYFRTLSDTP